jgi:hypothetical protein
MNTKQRFIISFTIPAIIFAGIGFLIYNKPMIKNDDPQASPKTLAERVMNGRCKAAPTYTSATTKILTTVIPDAGHNKSYIRIEVKKNIPSAEYDSHTVGITIVRNVEKIDVKTFDLKERVGSLLAEVPETKSIKVDYCS